MSDFLLLNDEHLQIISSYKHPFYRLELTSCELFIYFGVQKICKSATLILKKDLKIYTKNESVRRRMNSAY